MPRPVEDESLASWIDQVALEHGLVRGQAAGLLGLPRPASSEIIGVSQWMAEGCAEVADQVAAVTGLDPACIRDMTFERYRGTAWRLGAAARPISWLTSSWTRSIEHPDWILRTGSHTCPQCLADNGGRWLLRWRLPWVFLCPRHRCYLVDRCTCGTPLQWSQSLWADPCRGGRGCGSSCGVWAAQLPAVPVGDTRALATQQLIQALLDGAADPQRAVEIFVELHHMTRFVLYLAESAALEQVGADGAVVERFARSCAERDEAAAVAGQAFWGLRDYVPPPLLAAGAVRLAADVVFADDLEAQLARLLATARWTAPRDWARWDRFTVIWAGTPRLREALSSTGFPVSKAMDYYSAAIALRWRRGLRQAELGLPVG